MLKNKKFIVLMVAVILTAGLTLINFAEDNGSGQVDTVSAATAQVGEEIDRQTICVIIEDLTVIDTDDLEDEVDIIDDVEGYEAGTINIYSNEDAKITAYHTDEYENPEDASFERAVVQFEVQIAESDITTGYKSLLGQIGEDSAVDVTSNLKGVGISDIPVLYNIGINWEEPAPEGTYCTDVVFTLEAL